MCKGLIVLHRSGYWEHFPKAVSYTYSGTPDVDPEEAEDLSYQTVGTLDLMDKDGEVVHWLPAEVVAGIATAWVFPLTFPVKDPVSA